MHRRPRLCNRCSPNPCQCGCPRCGCLICECVSRGLSRRGNPESRKRFALKRDGKTVVICNTENDCLRELHKRSSSSWDWAFKYEGWSIVPVMSGNRSRFSRRSAMRRNASPGAYRNAHWDLVDHGQATQSNPMAQAEFVGLQSEPHGYFDRGMLFLKAARRATHPGIRSQNLKLAEFALHSLYGIIRTNVQIKGSDSFIDKVTKWARKLRREIEKAKGHLSRNPAPSSVASKAAPKKSRSSRAPHLKRFQVWKLKTPKGGIHGEKKLVGSANTLPEATRILRGAIRKGSSKWGQKIAHIWDSKLRKTHQVLDMAKKKRPKGRTAPTTVAVQYGIYIKTSPRTKSWTLCAIVNNREVARGQICRKLESLFAKGHKKAQGTFIPFSPGSNVPKSVSSQTIRKLSK